MVVVARRPGRQALPRQLGTTHQAAENTDPRQVPFLLHDPLIRTRRTVAGEEHRQSVGPLRAPSEVVEVALNGVARHADARRDRLQFQILARDALQLPRGFLDDIADPAPARKFDGHLQPVLPHEPVDRQGLLQQQARVSLVQGREPGGVFRAGPRQIDRLRKRVVLGVARDGGLDQVIESRHARRLRGRRRWLLPHGRSARRLQQRQDNPGSVRLKGELGCSSGDHRCVRRACRAQSW